MRSQKFNWLLIGIIGCLMLLIALQSFWMYKQVGWQRKTFNTLINATLETTIRHERELRCDSISHSIYRWLMDTSHTNMYSKVNEKYKATVYYLEDRNTNTPKTSSFSLSYENRPILPGKDDIRKIVVDKIVTDFREGYLNYQSIFYYTETMGEMAAALSDRLKLDSSRIKSLYEAQLFQQHIQVPFQLHWLVKADSTGFQELLVSGEHNDFQTHPFPSDIYKNGKKLYVYAVFSYPSEWLRLQLFIPLLLSVLVLLTISGLVFYLYRIIHRQKALSVIKNDFIDNMTHELKTPITVIATATEALQDFGVTLDPVKTKKYLGNIRHQAQHLQDVINKVLNISSYEKQELPLQKKWVSLRNTIYEIQQNRFDDSDKVILNTHIQKEDDTVWADPFHFRNILLNLIDNAIRYNEQKPVVIDIYLSQHGEYNRLSISDNGIGIPSAHWPHLFDKFYRVPKGNLHTVKGYGLGLFYVKKILLLHGGQISLDSTPGKGTRFDIDIPIKS